MTSDTPFTIVVAVVAAAFAASCGAEGHQCVDGGSAVHVQLTSPVDLARVRADDGAWTDLPEGGWFCAQATYDLLTVCSYPEGLLAQQFLRAVQDEDPVFSPCSSDDSERLRVTGTVDRPAVVRLGGDLDAGYSTPWQFELSVEPGDYSMFLSTSDLEGPDVVPPSVVIRRDLVLNEDVDVGMIDIGEEGILTESTPLSIDGRAPGDFLDVRVEATVTGTYGGVSTVYNDPMAYMVPPSKLDLNEEQWISVGSSHEDFSRSVEFTDPTVVARLPPVWDTASVTSTADSFVGAWTSLPFAPGTVLLGESFPDGSRYVWVSTSRLFDGPGEIAYDQTATDLYTFGEPSRDASLVLSGEQNGQFLRTSKRAITRALTGSESSGPHAAQPVPFDRADRSHRRTIENGTPSSSMRFRATKPPLTP